MTIQEIIEDHLRVKGVRGLETLCICGWHTARRLRPEDLHRTHLAEVLEKHMQERKAAAWNEAKDAVRSIPYWTDGTNHGFDMCEDEDGLSHETGARIAVMRILNENPYRKDTTNGR